MKKACRSDLPALLFLFALLMLWQLGAMKVNAAYILPTPIQILKKLWELRGVLFAVHLPATMLVTLLGLAISLALGLGLAEPPPQATIASIMATAMISARNFFMIVLSSLF